MASLSPLASRAAGRLCRQSRTRTGATPWTTTSSASPATSAGEMSRPAKTPGLDLRLPAPDTEKGVHPPGCTLQLVPAARRTPK